MTPENFLKLQPLSHLARNFKHLSYEWFYSSWSQYFLAFDILLKVSCDYYEGLYASLSTSKRYIQFSSRGKGKIIFK